MKNLFFIALLFAAAPVLAQTTAKASYSTNGKMVEIVELTGIHTCHMANVSGKVTKIKSSDTSAMVTLKKDDERIDFQIPLTNVKPDDKAAMFKHLVTKGNTLEMSGYRCDEAAPPSAFSVRRIY